MHRDKRNFEAGVPFDEPDDLREPMDRIADD